MLHRSHRPGMIPVQSANLRLLAAAVLATLAIPAAADELPAKSAETTRPATTTADEVGAGPETAAEPVVLERLVEGGAVFLNGRYLPPPYAIEATQSTATINGQPIPVSRIAALPAEFGASPHEDASRSGMRGNPWGRQRGLPGDGPRGRNRVETAAELTDDAPDAGEAGQTAEPNGKIRERNRHESSRADRSAGEYGPEFEEDEPPQNPWEERGLRRERAPFGSMARWTAQQLTFALENEMLVVMFDNLPLRVVNNPSDVETIYAILLADSPSPAEREQFVEFAYPPRAAARWSTWLDEFVPGPEALAMMQKVLDERDAIFAENMRQINATRRLDTLAYPLTIVGMFLSVVAFGHLLQWMGKGLAQNDENASVGAKHVVVSLGLMLGMALIDFVWTVLAGQAGVMREVNPLAAKFLDSPSELALFKVLATLTGFGILFVWRRRYQIQHATWWLCLACVLVTFRWVVFDSMLN